MENFVFKGQVILFSVLFALGCAATLIHFFLQKNKSKVIRKCIEENDLEKLKDIKLYDVSKMSGSYELAVDFFNVKKLSSKCRLMYCIEMLPIFFIAIQAVVALTLEQPVVGYLWALELLFFFVMLNINMQLSFIYKNSLGAGKVINNYVNDFESHILLHKLMRYAYIFIEIIVVALGFVCIFVPPLNSYWGIIFIAFSFAIAGILFGTYIGIKEHKKD